MNSNRTNNERFIFLYWIKCMLCMYFFKLLKILNIFNFSFLSQDHMILISKFLQTIFETTFWFWLHHLTIIIIVVYSNKHQKKLLNFNQCFFSAFCFNFIFFFFQIKAKKMDKAPQTLMIHVSYMKKFYSNFIFFKLFFFIQMFTQQLYFFFAISILYYSN